MAVQIQWRRDTAANWTAVNPLLAQGEAGLETDTGKFKLGDGVNNWNALSYFTDGVGIGGISAGTQSVTSGTVVFSNSNGISFGMSGSSRITASYTVPSTAGLLSAINVSGGTTSNNLSAITFSDGGNVSFGLNGSVITASAPAGGGGMAISAGTQSVNTGTLVFSNSNGITFGMAGSSRITASHDGLTTQSGQAFSADASSTFQTLTFQDSNGISFSNNAGALRITHGLQFTSATSAITSAALHTSASRVMNIIAATNNTAGGTASLSSNVSFSAANGITFYTSAGNAIVASHNALTTARASTDAVGLNTAQTNVTWTVNSSGLSFNAGGYAGTGTSNTGAASFTLNSNGLAFNGTSLAGVGTTFAGANISGSMTMNTAGLNLSMSVAAPGAAAEQNAFNLLGVNTAGNTTATGSTIGLSGIGVILSGTNNSQIIISAKDATLRDWDNMKVIQSMNLISNITATIFSRGRPMFFPMEVYGHLEWNKAMIEMSRSTSGSNAFTVGFGVYSFVNSTQISLLGSLTNAFSASNTASISGIRRFELSGIGTGASSLTPGHYIGALMFSAAGDATASMNYSLRGGLTANPPVGMIRPGSDSNITATTALSTLAIREFRGFWSTTTANPPDTVGRTQVSMWTTGPHPYLWLGSN